MDTYVKGMLVGVIFLKLINRIFVLAVLFLGNRNYVINQDKDYNIWSSLLYNEKKKYT